jgi:hypothetical protein
MRPGSAAPRTTAEVFAAVPAPAVRAPAPVVVEPSFELMRPRKRHGALWLVLGAAAAIGVFAARPWLSRRLAEATGSAEQAPQHGTEATQNAAALATQTTPSAVADTAGATGSSMIGIASTPATPSENKPAPPSRGAPRGAHVVIDDRLEPDVSPPPPLAPAPPETPKHEPAVEPPPPPPPPPPAPKPKQVPVSDADRYGI